jgi:hypothetical protein
MIGNSAVDQVRGSVTPRRTVGTSLAAIASDATPRLPAHRGRRTPTAPQPGGENPHTHADGDAVQRAEPGQPRLALRLAAGYLDVGLVRQGLDDPFNIGCGTCRNCDAGYTNACLRASPSGHPAAGYGYPMMGPYWGRSGPVPARAVGRVQPAEAAGRHRAQE